MEYEQIRAHMDTMIYRLGGKSVMIESDLADLFDVSPGDIRHAVHSNPGRFPEGFKISPTEDNINGLRTQMHQEDHIKLNNDMIILGEEGIFMLAFLLNSSRGIKISLYFNKIFFEYKKSVTLDDHVDKKIHDLESMTSKMFKFVFDKLEEYDTKLEPDLPENRKRIGL